MTSPHLPPVLRHIRKLMGVADASELTDAQLVKRYTVLGEEAAFEILLQRHAPMVLAVCRRLLVDAADVEDAFQATFLVLARRAASISWRESLGCWLYGVAYRVALKARVRSAVRRVREQEAASMSFPIVAAADPLPDLRPVLDEEVQGLPVKYREPLVLCYLEGKTNEEAAHQLGCPTGTIKTRLTKARELLRRRLTRRGLALSATAMGTVLSANLASAAVSASLLISTLDAAMRFAAGQAAAGAVPASAAALAEGVLQTMNHAKAKMLTALFLLLALAGGGVGLLARPSGGEVSPAEPPIQLPDNPRAVVLRWAVLRPGEPSTPPRLSVRADGSVTAHDEQGIARARLAPSELDALMRFLVREQDFFSLTTSRDRPGAELGTIVRVRLSADSRDHEVEWLKPVQSADRARLQAIGQRLEHLENWTYAGGTAGAETALRSINAQLQLQFPDVPGLTAADLQTVQRQGGTVRKITFERRGLAADSNPYSFVFGVVEQAAGAEPKVTVKANLLAANDQGDTKPFPRRTWDAAQDFPPQASMDKTVKFDYPIVYVRVPRPYPKDYYQINHLNQAGLHQTNAPGAELRLLHPDGRDESLVAVGPLESITDPAISFDGQWVYYAKFHQMGTKEEAHMTRVRSRRGSDIYKIHVPTRKVVQLTAQERTPNTGTVRDGTDSHPRGVHNLAPCPVPGGRIVFVSDRNGYRGVREQTQAAVQMFVMDDDGSNVDLIAPMNLGGALHPVPLKDGRVMFSSLETQGLRGSEQWGIWAIHPDGTNWSPLTSALGSPPGQAVHFQTQLSDESIVVESYYQTGSTDGFGTFWKFPMNLPGGQPRFLPGAKHFAPFGLVKLTLFASMSDVKPNDTDHHVTGPGPYFGQVTHPSGAPDNHMLAVWCPPSKAQDPSTPVYDAGIYLLKSGRAINHPSKMLLVKNDPKFQELWPRALVPYQRIYGVDEPKRLVHRNDGKMSKHLPAGTPFGLVGTSSLYKRESYPGGIVPPGSVTARSPRPNDRKQMWRELATNLGNWSQQGADAGLYENSDIWGIRIVILEPVSDRGHRDDSRNRHFALVSNTEERLRILGEFPVRKFLADGKQPLDLDGNPDTSFLAKIPANVAWTFQTLDNNGMVLNMAQTWHQVRPGEIRNDCGGCHAHSQKPTEFKLTAAAKPDYRIWDLTKELPLFTSKANDQSGRKADVQDRTGVRLVQGVKDVEFYRDVKPILDRSCVACHTIKNEKPAGRLALDDYRPYDKAGFAMGHVTWSGIRQLRKGLPRTYARLAQYSPPFQSRRSLLIWKVYGRRLDGFRNEDIDSPPLDYDNDQHIVNWGHHHHRERIDVDYKGSAMPPSEAVAGTYKGPDGNLIKVAPLSDEDKLTLVRWIDLGSPIECPDPKNPDERPGWFLDEGRPTLTLAEPQPGPTAQPLTHVLLGMYDYGSGLDLGSFTVTADFAIDGIPAGQNLAAKFKILPDNRWELKLANPLARLPKGKLTVSIKDKQGNLTKIERTFSVNASQASR